jgi:hypothetical protein
MTGTQIRIQFPSRTGAAWAGWLQETGLRSASGTANVGATHRRSIGQVPARIFGPDAGMPESMAKRRMIFRFAARFAYWPAVCV